MTTYPNPIEPYDPDGIDPDPFASPFPVLGEPFAAPPMAGDGSYVDPVSGASRPPGAEKPGRTIRRGQEHLIYPPMARDIFG